MASLHHGVIIKDQFAGRTAPERYHLDDETNYELHERAVRAKQLVRRIAQLESVGFPNSRRLKTVTLLDGSENAETDYTLHNDVSTIVKYANRKTARLTPPVQLEIAVSRDTERGYVVDVTKNDTVEQYAVLGSGAVAAVVDTKSWGALTEYIVDGASILFSHDDENPLRDRFTGMMHVVQLDSHPTELPHSDVLSQINRGMLFIQDSDKQ